MDLNARLSEHFTLRELVRSQQAARHGIDNTPPEAVVNSLELICVNILEPVRKHYGVPFSPNSGYRSPELNARIGGSRASQHISGQAVDIEVPGISNYDLAVWIKGNLIFDQLILEHYQPGDPYSGWVHVSYSGSGNRGHCLTFDGKSYKPGLLI